MKETSQSNRNIMSILVIVIGLLMMTVIPFSDLCGWRGAACHLAGNQKRRRVDVSNFHVAFCPARHRRHVHVPVLRQLGGRLPHSDVLMLRLTSRIQENFISVASAVPQVLKASRLTYANLRDGS